MRYPGRTSLTSMALAVLLTGCGDGRGGAAAVAAVDTVDGVIHLAYGSESAPSMAWGLDTVAVLGDPFAEDAYQFDQVTTQGLAGDDAGNLYVLDRQGARVLKYSTEGEHLATYGRKGEGPGEINQALGLNIGPGDTVWVTDFSNSRLTGYPQDGGEPRTVPYGDAGVPSGNFAVLDDGFIQDFRPLFNFRGGPGGMTRAGAEGEGEDSPPRIPLVRLDRSARLTDTLHTIPEPPMDMVQIEAGDRIMIMMMSREYWPSFQWRAFSDGAVVVSDTAAYQLRTLLTDGTLERVVSRAPDPRPVAEADREAARTRLREESGNQGGGIRIGGGGPDEAMQERILQQRLEKLTFADLVPRIVELRIDPLDRVWVGVREESSDEIDRIDIYDREGALVGELRDFPMPDVFLGTDHVGILRRDDLDVQQVVILRLDEADLG